MSLAIVHPLLLLHVTDHQTRAGQDVRGGVLGVYDKETDTYSLFLGFEIDTIEGLQDRLQLLRQIYPHLSLLGTYRAGETPELDLPTVTSPVRLQLLRDSQLAVDVDGKSLPFEIKATSFEQTALDTVSAAQVSQHSAAEIAAETKTDIDAVHARIRSVLSFLRTLQSRAPSPEEYAKLRQVNQLCIQMALLQNTPDQPSLSPTVINLSLLFDAVRKLDKLDYVTQHI
ncbi:hypothetical protein OGAPHI_005429 [Ogataea philodendri]|uniref:COP9 signalosome complex subunit 6 n=1 Tax=Ogataea philodendri TaxID=1378263 RepID=A0A9P8T1Y9_9ASCO|nr:uncharacterized protein OGAPHI_005429 [Ogataea philodendri]KAH3662181.1 hypothetical protein OGAPHI_005429 [Ogataea philodendri]